ncbi:uncharacterized protein JCM6883_003932 [Sporobolomyces salmoneus]|uniref:uncharacterized protein n=1 Tax=Sporobolomyces salmoneus TaxID=183962 RepID=UPI003179B806
MPSRSRPSSPSHHEKPYDQGSDQSSDEDFVNAATERRPSSRASAASGGSRSSRKPAVVSEGSSESVDSEEERELQSELQDAAGTETGVVRGAPVESTSARIMRSVGKNNSNSAASQRYAALSGADLEQGSSRSKSRKHRYKHRSAARDYSLADSTKQKKQKKQKGLALGPGEGAFSDHRASTLQGKTKSKRTWLWVFLGLLGLIVVGLIIFAIVYFVKRKSGDSADDLDSASNSTSLSDHANSTTTGNSTAGHHASNSTGLDHDSATQTRLPVDGSAHETASPTNTGSFDDGKYHASTGSASTTAGPNGTSTSGQGTEDAHHGTSDADKTGIASDESETLHSGHPSASTAGAAATQGYGTASSQAYGVPSATGSETVEDSIATGQTAREGVASIQTVPNPEPSSVSDQANQQAGSSGSNAGQWNPLSNGATQPTATQGAQTQPTQAQGQGASQTSLQFGPGPAVPSATGALEGAATPTNPIVIGGGAQQDWNNNGQPSSWDASQQAQAQPASSIDSTAPGPYSAGEFRQATHPESFQTFIDAPATWFESSGHYGACGVAPNNTDFVVAINDAVWLNSTKGSTTSQSSYCGAEVLLTSMTDGATVNAWVTERCAYCSKDSAGSIDLSKAVFKALAGGSTDAGSLTLVWGFTGNYSASTLPAQAGSNSTASDSVDEETNSTSSDGWFWKRQEPTRTSVSLMPTML